jgi:NAD(P)-dependent dehydrogenase (short-subunit alcohol dehydrogenase family)
MQQGYLVMRLKGKNALITGGNSGIGLATAKRFVEEGARVLITGRDAKTLAFAESSLGSSAISIRADVVDADARARVIAAAKENFGNLDIVFANAGIAKSTTSSIVDTPEDIYDEVLKTNVTAVFLTVQGALPLLRDRASIILNSSVAANAGFPGSGAYPASKAAVKAMAHSLASELAPRRIRVNCVVPGVIRTPVWNRGRSPEQGEARVKQMLKKVPFGEIGEAEDVANAVLFLASDESRYITSTEITIDGGFSGSHAAV